MAESILYSCSEDVLESKIDQEIVLMSLNGGTYFGLDEVASRIWGLLLEKPLTIDALCNILQDEYDIDESSCRRDTIVFLDELFEKGLINKAYND